MMEGMELQRFCGEALGILQYGYGYFAALF